MKPTRRTADEYLRIINMIIPMGWMPVGAFGSMVFRKNCRNYDLSAADLTMLDDIEANGSFLIQDQ